jgi:cytochrome c553
VTAGMIRAMGGLLVGLGWLATSALGEDVAKGRLLSEACAGCHSIEGQRNAYPSYRVPKLGGQHQRYLADALKAYREGARPHPTMQAQAASLSDQDIHDLAAFFASLGKATEASTTASAGADVAKTCSSCHGDSGFGLSPEMPTLAGQYESYLRESLMQYKKGKRTNGIMAGLVIPLSEDDIKAVSVYYAAQAGLFTASRE